MNKISTDMILENEAEMLLDAIGNCLELTDDFLDRYCNNDFGKLMSTIPECDREYVLYGIDAETTWNGFPPSKDWQHIWLDVSEIEYQFEGDLAYLYTGYGLSITFDEVQLKDSIEDYKS